MMESIIGKKTSPAKATQSSTQSDIELMKDILQRRGIDLDAERDRREHDKVMAAKRERVQAEKQASYEHEAKEIEAKLQELVKEGHIRVRVGGIVTTDPDLICPSCGAPLRQYEVIREYAEFWWRNGADQQYGVRGLILNGRGFRETSIKCDKCSKQVEVTAQLVI